MKVVGVYRVPATPELLAEAMELKYEGLDLSPQDRLEAEASIREELGSVVLVEMHVTPADGRFEVGDIGQPGSDQAPYNEAYLSEDGSVLIPRVDPPTEQSFRVAFFLHCYDSDLGIGGTHGALRCPPITEMPARLIELVPYTPVD